MIRNALIFIFLSAGSLWAGNVTQSTFNQGVTAIPATKGGGSVNCATTELNQLSLFYTLEEGVDTTTADISTGTHTGTLVNTPTWLGSGNGKCGNALSFSAASSEYITVANGPVIGVDQNVFTITAWINYTDGTAYMEIYTEGDTTATATLELGVNHDATDGNAWAYVNNGTDTDLLQSADLNLDDGAWHFVVFVQSAVDARELYVDGVSRATGSTSVDYASGDLDTSSIARLFRSGATENTFTGSIDQVRVYAGRAFTGGEVTALFNAGK